MTVQNATIRNDYDGNGVDDVFDYTFKIYAATDITVATQDASGAETTLTYPTDYSVSGVGVAGGGSITLTAGALASGYKIAIVGDFDLTQKTDLRNQGGYFPDTLEDALDRLMKVCLQQQDQLDRSIKYPLTDPGSSATSLPAASVRASKFLAFDAAGIPIAADSVSSTPVSPFMVTVLDDADAPTARTTLGAAADSAVVHNTGNENIAGTKTFSDAPTLTSGAVFNGASSGPFAPWSTGDVKLTLKAVADSGWVLANDGTIGNAASGATTRANADTQALFTLLYTSVSDTYAPVSGGRGADATTDFNAGKTITLTKMLGRALAIAGSGSGLTARSLGATVGEETHVLTTPEMPAHTHSGAMGSPGSYWGTNTAGFGSAYSAANTGSTGGGGAHNNMQPTSFLNAMIKL